jgi:hypothetical protein
MTRRGRYYILGCCSLTNLGMQMDTQSGYIDTSALLVQIGKAFPAHPLPAMSLRQAHLADLRSGRCIVASEWKAERLKDGAVLWPAIADAALLECGDGLAYLDEKSFAYYLGAFLCFAVRQIDAPLSSAEGDLVDSIVFSVTSRCSYNLRRLKRLSDPQIQAVTDFLHLFQDRSESCGIDAVEALEHYWYTPEAHRKSALQAGRTQRPRGRAASHRI